MTEDKAKQQAGKKIPIIRQVGKKLQLAELAVLHKKFDIPMEECQIWLHRLGVPVLEIGPAIYFSMNTLEEVLTERCALGGRGMKFRGRPPLLKNIGPDGLTPRQRQYRRDPAKIREQNRLAKERKRLKKE